MKFLVGALIALLVAGFTLPVPTGAQGPFSAQVVRALTAYGFSAPGVLTVTSCTGCGGGAAATYVEKSSNEAVTSSTTLQDDDALTFTASVNTDYLVRIYMVTDGNTLGDIKVGMTVPASTNGWFAGTMDGADQAKVDFSGSQAFQLDGAATEVLVHITALVRVAGTGGAVTVQWAQNTSSGTATNVFADSFLSYEEVSF